MPSDPSLPGYARVPTTGQDHHQHRALRDAGCERIWTEHPSGAHRQRPERLALQDHLRAGDRGRVEASSCSPLPAAWVTGSSRIAAVPGDGLLLEIAFPVLAVLNAHRRLLGHAEHRDPLAGA